MKKEVYLDNGATTRVGPKVHEAMKPYFEEKYGNPASAHSKGREAKRALNKARKTIAKSMGAKKKEIVFTSGGTESNNLAVKGIAFANREKGNHIVTTKIEHKSILKPVEWLVETQGLTATYLDVDEEGFVDPEDLEKAITDETILVSVINGNNEVGTVQNLEELGKVTKEKGVLFHTDACQSYTKTELDVEKHNLDLVTVNSHKINGPKGVGALYIRKGMELTPINHGGGHEGNIRSGTPNVHGIVGFAKAVEEGNKKKHREKMARLRDKLIEEALKIPRSKLNGPKGKERLPNNVNLYFKGIEGEALAGYMERKGIYTSTGSACSSKSLEPSHVLTAIGMEPEQANSSIRMTLSRFTTEEDIDYVASKMSGIVKKLRGISPLF